MKRIWMALFLLCAACSLAACGRMDQRIETESVQQEETSNRRNIPEISTTADQSEDSDTVEAESLQELLLSHYWMNDFQVYNLYRFTEDGKIYQYEYVGSDIFEHGSEGRNYFNKEWIPNPEYLYDDGIVGTYTIEGDDVVILFDHNISSGYETRIANIDNEDTEVYRSRYNGEYFLFEYGFEYSPVQTEESPFYLYEAGEYDEIPMTVEQMESKEKGWLDWVGVYRYDNGDQGLYIFVDRVTEDYIYGIIMYEFHDIEYDFRRFTWNREPADPNTASEDYQAGRLVYYRWNGSQIAVDYPIDTWDEHIYEYICPLDRIREEIDHPLIEDILPELDMEMTGTGEGAASASSSAAQNSFYGIWVIGSKNQDDCNPVVEDLKNAGFSAKVYVTTDWEDLNSEKWYVVSAGEYDTKEAAEAMLSRVKAAGYADAYVKYTGEHR